MGPLSLDIFKKNNLSASWKVFGAKTLVVDTSEVRMTLILLLESTVISCTLFVLLKACQLIAFALLMFLGCDCVQSQTKRLQTSKRKHLREKRIIPQVIISFCRRIWIYVILFYFPFNLGFSMSF